MSRKQKMMIAIPVIILVSTLEVVAGGKWLFPAFVLNATIATWMWL